MIWIVNVLLGGGTVFLLLFGEWIADRLFNRRENP